MYTTYAISDPRTRLFVYVGQTNNYELRRQQHLKAHRQRKAKPGSLQHWLKALHAEKHEPVFTLLEIVETEAESLESENKWVEKIAALGHPLFNGWEEHKALIETSGTGVGSTLVPLIFTKGPRKKPQSIGHVEPNSSKTGYRVHVDEGVELVGPLTIDLLPPKKQ